MNSLKLLCAAIAGALALAVLAPTPASAQFGNFKNFDSALTVIGGIADRGLFAQPNAVDLSSVTCTLTGPPNTSDPDCTNAPPYNVTDSGITFKPNRPFSLSQLSKLSAAFNFNGTDCGGGSPRVEVNLSGGNFLTGYFGPPPEFTSCPAGWQNTGNMVDPTSLDKRWAVGNSGSYDTYANTSAAFNGQNVTEIDLVVDGGWFLPPKGQDVTIDDFTVNNNVYP